MLIKFFRNGQGGGAGPVDYLVEREVLAHDDNRNVLRDREGNVLMFERDPLPDVLRGDLQGPFVALCIHGEKPQWRGK